MTLGCFTVQKLLSAFQTFHKRKNLMIYSEEKPRSDEELAGGYINGLFINFWPDRRFLFWAYVLLSQSENVSDWVTKKSISPIISIHWFSTETLSHAGKGLAVEVKFCCGSQDVSLKQEQLTSLLPKLNWWKLLNLGTTYSEKY